MADRWSLILRVSTKGAQVTPMQSSAQGAALDAAGVRQDADVSAALSGQHTGELAGMGQAI